MQIFVNSFLHYAYYIDPKKILAYVLTLIEEAYSYFLVLKLHFLFLQLRNISDIQRTTYKYFIVLVKIVPFSKNFDAPFNSFN